MAPGEWLNDEMVNFTIGTMADREMARRGGKQPKVHFFNTFFVKKMCDGDEGYNYNAVRRWTTKKKLGYDLLECEKLVIPVHQGDSLGPRRRRPHGEKDSLLRLAPRRR